MFICEGEWKLENCCWEGDCKVWNCCGDDESNGLLKCWSFCDGGRKGEFDDCLLKCWSFGWFVFDGDCDWNLGKEVECCSCVVEFLCELSEEVRFKLFKLLLILLNIFRNGFVMIGYWWKGNFIEKYGFYVMVDFFEFFIVMLFFWIYVWNVF